MERIKVCLRLMAVCHPLLSSQAIQFVAEHGEVCPANWTPGGATMHADPEKSLEYFATAGEVSGGGGGQDRRCLVSGWMHAQAARPDRATDGP